MNIAEYITSCKWWRHAAGLVRRLRKPFLILYGYAVLIYLPMLVLRLTNDLDGVWNQDDYVAGAWELSIGRWFWPYLDRLRFTISLDPVPGMVSLALYVVTFLLILSVLHIPLSPITYLAGFLFLSGTAITCQMSHGYMVITFAVSSFLAVLAVWLSSAPAECTISFRRTLLRRILPSAAAIAVMMGCYQAGIGITCLAALFVFLMALSGHGNDREDSGNGLRTAFSFAGRMLAALVIGAVFYELLLQVHLKVFNMTLSSYQDFSQIGPAYFFAHLPDGIKHAYRMIRLYLFDGTFRYNALQTCAWFPAVYLVPAAGVLCGAASAFRKGRWNGIWYTAGVMLIPVFAGSFYLLAAAAETHMQMLTSYSLILPLMLCQLNDIQLKKDGSALLRGAAAAAAGAGMAILVWGAAGMSLTDQYAMYAGRKASATLAESILNQAADQGQDYVNGQILIAGTPAQSPTFAVGDLYYSANSYAQFGNWSESVSYGRLSWSALYDNYLRVEVTFSTDDTEATIAALPEVAAMPVYPASGSVQNIYGVTVIRVGENYE